MGVMRFLVCPAGFLGQWPEAEAAYISGFDGRVFQTDVERDGDELVCRRPSSESGRLHVAWPVRGFGRTLISTSSLREQDEVYLLPVELARGKIGQLRNQLATWEIAGMGVPEGYLETSREAHRLFARSTALQEEPEEACRLADEAIVQAHEAADRLTRAYVDQRLNVRRLRSPRFPTSLACGLGRGPARPAWDMVPRGIFNSASIPVRWREIEANEGEYAWEESDGQLEWCLGERLLPRGGPLLDFSEGGMPEWLELWAGDPENLQSFLCDFVETALSRYGGRVRVWEIASRVNTGGGLGLGEEERMGLVARAVEIARKVADVDQLLVRIDQPWGGYQAHGSHLLSPLQFVDGLVRSAPGLSGISLEIGAGFAPGEPGRRDLLDLSRLIDLWSTLGLPLHISLACPSGDGVDPQGEPAGQVAATNGTGEDGGAWTESRQASWVDAVLPLLIAKQGVVGITWAHLADAVPHEFAHAGLLRPDGTAKPVLETIQRHRFAHWPEA